jgi:hypothetical protein
LVENEIGKRLKCLISDNGGEYFSKDFDDYYSYHGIHREKDSSRNKTRKWCVRKDEQDNHGVCKEYEIACWVSLTVLGRCCRYCCLLNKHRGPSSSLDGGIPEEAWTGKKVNYSFLKTFGCEAFVHIDKENRTKLEAKSKKCTFIGYSVNDFGYRLWDYENQKIIRSRDVIFNEKVMYKDQLQGKKHEKEKPEYTVLDEITEKEIPKVPENQNVQQ